MEMETEIIVVIIASVASLIVGLINIIFNVKISSKQNKIELKKTRIELLETRRQKIESIKAEISNRSIDLADVRSFVFELHFSRMIDFFQKNSSNVLSIGHLLNTGFILELKKLNIRINDYIAKSKQNIVINDNEIKSDIKKLAELSSQMHEELDKSLRMIENEINALLK